LEDLKREMEMVGQRSLILSVWLKLWLVLAIIVTGLYSYLCLSVHDKSFIAFLI